MGVCRVQTKLGRPEEEDGDSGGVFSGAFSGVPQRRPRPVSFGPYRRIDILSIPHQEWPCALTCVSVRS